MPSSDAQGTSWKEVCEELNRLHCLMANTKASFDAAAGRGGAVEDSRVVSLPVIEDAETAGISFVQEGHAAGGQSYQFGKPGGLKEIRDALEAFRSR